MKKIIWLVFICLMACSKRKAESNFPTGTKGVPFEFVLDKPVLTIKDTEGVSFDRPIKETVKVVSDTTERVFLVYFDKEVVYEVDDAIYQNGGRTIGNRDRVVVTIFESDNKLLKDQIYINLDNAKVISAKGDFHISGRTVN